MTLRTTMWVTSALLALALGMTFIPGVMWHTPYAPKERLEAEAIDELTHIADNDPAAVCKIPPPSVLDKAIARRNPLPADPFDERVVLEPGTPATSIEAILRLITVPLLSRNGDGTWRWVGLSTAVTNRHVVTDAARISSESELYVQLHSSTPVRVSQLPNAGRTLTLLELETVLPSRAYPIATTTLAWQPVFASVYPGLELDEVPAGQDITELDRLRPTARLANVFSATRPPLGPTGILHTAPVSAHETGGPIVDECGRLVGINLHRPETQLAGSSGLAADGEAIWELLTRAGMEHSLASGACGVPKASAADASQ